MMNCTAFLDGFSEYLDGELSAQVAAGFEAHLEACDECRRYRDVMVRSLDLVRALDPPNPSELFRDRLNARIYFEEGKTRATGPVGSGATSGTMLVMTVLFAAAAWSPTLGSEREDGALAADQEVSVAEGSAMPISPLVRSTGLSAFAAGQITLYQAGELEEDLWSYPNAVFFEYSSLSKRGQVESLGDVVRSVGLQ